MMASGFSGIPLRSLGRSWIQDVRAAERDKPWFCYFSTGAVHAPHHARKEWIEKFKGKFDYGWDEQRKKTHQRQLELGVIPAGTALTPRHREVPSWQSRSADEKTAYARLLENYAAFMAHTDRYVRSVIDSIEEAGELDNTLVLYIVGDNGASSEGSLEGTYIDLARMVGIDLGLRSLLSRLDDTGGPECQPHVPVWWAWAMCAPFQWTRAVPSHFGGTRNPLLAHWPNRMKGKDEIRSQFHHVIDVVPTILEACNSIAEFHRKRAVIGLMNRGQRFFHVSRTTHVIGRRSKQQQHPESIRQTGSL
jgi:arylsulfatase